MKGYSWNWQVIWQYRAIFPQALGLSLALAAAALLVGFVLGLGLAYLCISPWRPVRLAAMAFGRIARSTPLLLLVFVFYLVLPQWGIRLFDPQSAFVTALAITAGGYIAENFRASLVAIPRRHVEAARSLGLVGWQRQFYVVLPLTVRHAFPALSNSVVATFKDTSVASIIAISELTYIAKEISTNYFRVFEAWTAVSLIYLVASALIALALRVLEARLPGRAA
ncbi:MAG TPA: amino acid ABC transporter permease [Devosiaceae bacterium]|jgi:polar amino acid transport system permease protein